MAEEDFEQDVRSYRQEIMKVITHAGPQFRWKTEAPTLFARFDVLSQQNVAYFWKICARLLKDEKREIRLGTMKLLQSFTKKDRPRIVNNGLSLLLSRIALEQRDLRNEAIFALWNVGTRSVLPLILLFAETGSFPALYMAQHLLQTPEEIEQGIAIARKYIDADEYELRETALFLLQKYSSMEQEAERVLNAVQKYLDETFIEMLKSAPPERVLQPLKILRKTIDEKYAEYKDLSSTIDALEQQKCFNKQET